MNKLTCALLFALFVSSALAASKTWVGADIADLVGEWNNAAHWSPAGVPGASDDVIISDSRPGPTDVPCITVTAGRYAVQSLTFETDMVQICGAGKGTTTITISGAFAWNLGWFKDMNIIAAGTTTVPSTTGSDNRLDNSNFQNTGTFTSTNMELIAVGDSQVFNSGTMTVTSTGNGFVPLRWWAPIINALDSASVCTMANTGSLTLTDTDMGCAYTQTGGTLTINGFVVFDDFDRGVSFTRPVHTFGGALIVTANSELKSHLWNDVVFAAGFSSTNSAPTGRFVINGQTNQKTRVDINLAANFGGHVFISWTEIQLTADVNFARLEWESGEFLAGAAKRKITVQNLDLSARTDEEKYQILDGHRIEIAEGGEWKAGASPQDYRSYQLNNDARLVILAAAKINITKGACFQTTTPNSAGRIVNNGLITSYVGSTTFIELFFEHRGSFVNARDAAIYNDQPTTLYPQLFNALEGGISAGSWSLSAQAGTYYFDWPAVVVAGPWTFESTTVFTGGDMFELRGLNTLYNNPWEAIKDTPAAYTASIKQFPVAMTLSPAFNFVIGHVQPVIVGESLTFSNALDWQEAFVIGSTSLNIASTANATFYDSGSGSPILNRRTVNVQGKLTMLAGATELIMANESRILTTVGSLITFGHVGVVKTDPATCDTGCFIETRGNVDFEYNVFAHRFKVPLVAFSGEWKFMTTSSANAKASFAPYAPVVIAGNVKVNMRIAGTAAGSYDDWSPAEAATQHLGGQLNLIFESPFAASAGQSWDLITYTLNFNEVWGEFTSVTATGLSAGLGVRVKSYETVISSDARAVTVEVCTLPCQASATRTELVGVKPSVTAMLVKFYGTSPLGGSPPTTGTPPPPTTTGTPPPTTTTSVTPPPSTTTSTGTDPQPAPTATTTTGTPPPTTTSTGTPPTTTSTGTPPPTTTTSVTPQPTTTTSVTPPPTTTTATTPQPTSSTAISPPPTTTSNPTPGTIGSASARAVSVLVAAIAIVAALTL